MPAVDSWRAVPSPASTMKIRRRYDGTEHDTLLSATWFHSQAPIPHRVRFTRRWQGPQGLIHVPLAYTNLLYRTQPAALSESCGNVW